MIEIVSSGNLNLIQDLGRTGHMHEGVSRSGAMDCEALKYANALVGNPDDAAGLEITTFPFRFLCHAPMLISATGALASWRVDTEAVAPWWVRRVHAGQEVEVQHPEAGARVYLAFSGGLDVPVVLGSRSTDVKGGFGGHEGRGLRKGDRLQLLFEQCPDWQGKGLGCAPEHVRPFWTALHERHACLRVIAGAEFENFTQQANTVFLETSWKISPSSNRQGYRLQGPTGLALHKPVELLSHGIVPGTVQVPPDGQPIIQLSEANTCGGYPKIATVIEADLWKVAQLNTSTQVRFQFVEMDQALEAMRKQNTEILRIRDALLLMRNRA